MDAVVVGFYDNLRLLHPYEKMMSNLISRFNPLIANSLRTYSELSSDRIELISEEYYEEHKNEMNVQNTTYLRNAFEFLRYARNSPEDIQPILFHYSWQFFAAFFKYTFFKWSSPAGGHGIHVMLDGLDSIEIQFSGRPGGSFQRLVDCLTILGIPTIFGKWLPIPEKKSLTFERNDLNHSFVGGTKWHFTNILDFEVSEFVAEVGEKYKNWGFGVHDVRRVNEELLGYVVVFVASNMARYRPALWMKVIDASDEPSLRAHNTVIESYAHYMLGSQILRDQNIYLPDNENFMGSVKQIMMLAQNEHWLQDHFNGSFAIRR